MITSPSCCSRTLACKYMLLRSGDSRKNWLINSQMDRDPEFVKSWPFQKTPNVALTSAGVVLKYNVTTIAPYALGLIEMTIPYARLTGVLKPELMPARH